MAPTTNTGAKYKDFFKKTFKNEPFPIQEKSLDAIVVDNEPAVFINSGTGTGKSAIYQTNAGLNPDKLHIVVSPLIALMNNQINNAPEGIVAKQLHSNVSSSEKEEIFGGSKINMLYVSPEQLSTKVFQDFVADRNIGSLTVDEAHCVSLWGHDFRPSFLSIPDFWKKVDRPQLVLCTATAPPHIKDDVLDIFDINDDCKYIEGELMRKNIKFDVESSYNKNKTVLDMIRELPNNNGKTIIYCNYVDDVEELHNFLLENHINNSYFNGQMEKVDKIKNQKEFIDDENGIMICTNAFGMGIDLPNVKTIIHYSPPKSLEHYIQEAGRAGRNGEFARATLIYDYDDIDRHKRNIVRNIPSLEILKRTFNMVMNHNERYGDKRKISYQSLKYAISKQKKTEDSYYQEKQIGALNLLFDSGIIMEGEFGLIFNAKSSKEYEAIIENKYLAQTRSLEIMELYITSYGENKTHTQVVENYLKGATSKLVQQKESIASTMRRTILSGINELVGSTQKELCGIFVNPKSKAEHSDNDALEKYKGSLPFMSPSDITHNISNFKYDGLIKTINIGKNKNIPYVTKKGEEYLTSKGFEVTKNKHPLYNEDAMSDIFSQTREWALGEDLDTFDYLSYWDEAFSEFNTHEFKIGGKAYTGSELLCNIFDMKKPTVQKYYDFINILGGTKRIVGNEKKRVYRH